MTKTRVVGLAPYPVVLSDGSHVAAGEVKNILLDNDAQVSVDLGKLGIVPVATEATDVEAPATKTRTKTASTSTSQETE